MQDFLAFARQLECHFQHPSNLIFIVFEHFVDIAATGFIDTAFLFAEVKAANEFSNDDEIYSLADDFGLEWGEMGQAARQVHRAKVGISVVTPAHGK